MEAWRQELYHHGIKGMHWGVRRYQNPDGSLTSAGKKRYDVGEQKERMKSAKKDAKIASKAYRKKRMFALGIKRRQRASDAKVEKTNARLAYIDEKAKYKAAKSKNSEKAEFRTYRRAMTRHGMRGSVANAISGQASAKLYDHIATKKGKEYADRVEKSVFNRSMAHIAGGTAVAVGASVVSYYLNHKG